MNTRVLSLLVSTFMGFATLNAEPVNLEVHEWGTFTIASGSNGTPLRWYQPEIELAELPSFVGRNITVAGKGGTEELPSFVRMETPVIYFYPDKPMPVSVQVTMQAGRVTEWFPGPSAVKFSSKTLSMLNAAVSWSGELVAPGDAAALTQIPPFKDGPGANYFHAREVPGAWIFHATKIASGFPLPSPPAEKPKQAEKFIFYRGAGDYLPPFQAQAGESRVPGDVYLSLEHSGYGGAIEAAFAISVKNGKMSWLPVNAKLPATDPNDGSSFSVRVGASLGEPSTPLPKAENELVTAMTGALSKAGLSQDEAKAMVATWGDIWFREPGTRILALLPRDWVDTALPLTITPAPKKLTRVFVARFEVFTSDREKALLSLLEGGEKPTAQTLTKFKSLQFGRFATAALEDAKSIQSQRLSQRFYELQQSDEPTTAAR
ncbi:MAG: hypothetical protein WCN98_05920 [Verrucomicrobiaceae bacterium]